MLFPAPDHPRFGGGRSESPDRRLRMNAAISDSSSTSLSSAAFTVVRGAPRAFAFSIAWRMPLGSILSVAAIRSTAAAICFRSRDARRNASLDAALSLSHSRGTARSSSVIGRLDPGLGRVSSVGFTEKLSSVPWNKKPGPGPGAPMSSLPNKSLYPARSKDTFSSSTTNEDDAPSPSPSPLSAPAADVSTEMRGRARPPCSRTHLGDGFDGFEGADARQTLSPSSSAPFNSNSSSKSSSALSSSSSSVAAPPTSARNSPRNFSRFFNRALHADALNAASESPTLNVASSSIVPVSSSESSPRVMPTSVSALYF
eukprot:31502-Pelagococcus_subviridis.AAC.16